MSTHSHQEHLVRIRVKVLPFPGHPHGIKKVYASHQSNSPSCDKYFETTLNLGNVISHCGSVIGNQPFLVEKFMKAAELVDDNNPTEDETTVAKTATEEAYMATAFLSGLNNARFRALLNELHNAFRMGHNEHPKTLTSAYDLAIKWKGDSKGIGVTPNDGVAFITEADEVDVHATDRVKMTRTGKPEICHICGKNHYANRCPYREDGTQEKKATKVEDTPRAGSPPTKAAPPCVQHLNRLEGDGTVASSNKVLSKM